MVTVQNAVLAVRYAEDARRFEVAALAGNGRWYSAPLDARYRVLEAEVGGWQREDRIQIALYDRANQADLLATWVVHPEAARLSLALNVLEGNGAALLTAVAYPPLFVPDSGGHYNWQTAAEEMQVRVSGEDGEWCTLNCETAEHARLEYDAQSGVWQLVWMLVEDALGYTRIVHFDFGEV